MSRVTTAEQRLAAAQHNAREALSLARGDAHEYVRISMKSFYGLRGLWCGTVSTKKLSVAVLRKMYEESVIKQVTEVVLGER